MSLEGLPREDCVKLFADTIAEVLTAVSHDNPGAVVWAFENRIHLQEKFIAVSERVALLSDTMPTAETFNEALAEYRDVVARMVKAFCLAKAAEEL